MIFGDDIITFKKNISYIIYCYAFVIEIKVILKLNKKLINNDFFFIIILVLNLT